MKDIPMTPMQLTFEHLSEFANPNSGELITLAGHLNVHRLRQAIGLALERHPLLNCVPHVRFGTRAWRPSPTPLPIDLQVHHTKERNRDLLMPELCRNLWEQRIPENARQVRFIYTMGPRRSYLQICAPHSLTDACAGNRLAADIASAYTALTEGRKWEVKKVRPLDQPASKVFLGHLSLFEKVKLMFEAAKKMVEEIIQPGNGLHLEQTKTPGETGVNISEFGSHLLKKTIHAARHHGVTAHSLFLLALTRARQDMLGGEKGDSRFRINDMATLRSFANRDVKEAFDVLVVPHQLDIEPTWDDEKALNYISSQIKAKKNGAILSEIYRLSLYGFLARFLPMRYTANFVFRHVNKTDIAVTNPGRVLWEDELERFGNVRIDDFINFPHLLPPAKVILIFTTFRNQLRLVQLFDSKIMPGGIEKDLIAGFVAHLERLADELGDPRDLQKIIERADTVELQIPRFGKRPRRARNLDPLPTRRRRRSAAS